MLLRKEELAVGWQSLLWTTQHMEQEHHSQHSCYAHLTAFLKHCRAGTSVCVTTWLKPHHRRLMQSWQTIDRAFCG